jgi:hypothetical protein
MTRTSDKPAKPHQTPRTTAEKTARHERLAEEMRKNLLRRKQRQRSQEDKIRKGDG